MVFSRSFFVTHWYWKSFNALYPVSEWSRNFTNGDMAAFSKANLFEALDHRIGQFFLTVCRNSSHGCKQVLIIVSDLNRAFSNIRQQSFLNHFFHSTDNFLRRFFWVFIAKIKNIFDKFIAENACCCSAISSFCSSSHRAR